MLRPAKANRVASRVPTRVAAMSNAFYFTDSHNALATNIGGAKNSLVSRGFDEAIAGLGRFADPTSFDARKPYGPIPCGPTHRLPPGIESAFSGGG